MFCFHFSFERSVVFNQKQILFGIVPDALIHKIGIEIPFFIFQQLRGYAFLIVINLIPIAEFDIILPILYVG